MFSPDLQCSGGLSPGPFCVEFACSPRVHKGFPPITTPTEKHAEEQNTLLSVPDQDTDGSPDLVRGCLKAAHCSWGQGERTDWNVKNAENKFTATSACVCVCVCGHPKCTCVVCANKNLTKV